MYVVVVVLLHVWETFSVFILIISSEEGVTAFFVAAVNKVTAEHRLKVKYYKLNEALPKNEDDDDDKR